MDPLITQQFPNLLALGDLRRVRGGKVTKRLRYNEHGSERRRRARKRNPNGQGLNAISAMKFVLVTLIQRNEEGIVLCY